MSNIPEDIMNLIKKEFPFSDIPYTVIKMRERSAAEFGYSLALSKIEQLEKTVAEQAKEIEQLKKENEDLRSFRSGTHYKNQ